LLGLSELTPESVTELFDAPAHEAKKT